ncbi:MAG: carotenoid biosynthesis protein [Spirochaetaceae bacterium]|nr:MAG: carotenoid biosynthesis protein [Spirochaetaceae bacterium]
MNKRELIVAVLLGAFFLVGFIGHSLQVTLPWMLRMTPYTLFACGLIAFLPVVLERSRGVLLWALLVFLVTFALEALGTATGKIFGPYTYGQTLGPKLFAVPVVIAFNWLLIILGALSLAHLIFRNRLIVAFVTALLAAGFDYLLEPTAIRLDYWTWQTPGIPLQNYLAWFLIALAAALFYLYFKLSVKTRLPLIYFLIQLLFFALLRIFPLA